MNAPTYVNNAHKALARNPGGLTLEELSGKLRVKALKVSQQIRELHDAGLIETTEDAGQPVYRLIAAPAAESVRDDSSLPTKTYPPAVLQSMIADLSGDSEGGETDAPAAINDTPKFGHGLSCGACHDGCAGEQCKVERDSPPIDARREEFTLLGLLADIRAAAGDPDGRLMQDELVQHIAGVVKERDDLRERLDAQIKQWQTDTGRLAADLRAAMESRSQAINEAARLRAELATERQAREALQEQSDAVDVKDAAVGYLVRVPKRAPILRRKPESARSAALSAVRAGAARADVLAVVPVGTARRGAEWQSTEAGG